MPAGTAFLALILERSEGFPAAVSLLFESRPLELLRPHFREALAPLLKFFLLVPFAIFEPESLTINRPGRGQNVRVIMADITVIVGTVDGPINHHSFPNQVPREVLHKPLALLCGEFMRKGNLEIARLLRGGVPAAPILGLGGLVLRLLPITRPRGSILRSKDTLTTLRAEINAPCP